MCGETRAEPGSRVIRDSLNQSWGLGEPQRVQIPSETQLNALLSPPAFKLVRPVTQLRFYITHNVPAQRYAYTERAARQYGPRISQSKYGQQLGPPPRLAYRGGRAASDRLIRRRFADRIPPTLVTPQLASCPRLAQLHRRRGGGGGVLFQEIRYRVQNRIDWVISHTAFHPSPLERAAVAASRRNLAHLTSRLKQKPLAASRHERDQRSCSAECARQPSPIKVTTENEWLAMTSLLLQGGYVTDRWDGGRGGGSAPMSSL
ncbi:hypothetical protein SKAU_G00399060 [Synaphobranchus kaupii]|uniref:Uncharacterized protein n=1 Tax=Synaphobranchus kaupii TaxID=118154 RepID=A0A9Q1E8S9_SYNKA|nr:hypothetical protein SKAU_G00399060 [Synaphobranchus kaupii]